MGIHQNAVQGGLPLGVLPTSNTNLRGCWEVYQCLPGSFPGAPPSESPGGICLASLLPPMVHYHLRQFRLRCHRSRHEVLQGVDVLLRGCGSILQSKETAPHKLDPIVVHSEGLIPFLKDVFLFHPSGQSRFPLRHALLFFSCCPLLGR